MRVGASNADELMWSGYILNPVSLQMSAIIINLIVYRLSSDTGNIQMY